MKKSKISIAILIIVVALCSSSCKKVSQECKNRDSGFLKVNVVGNHIYDVLVDDNGTDVLTNQPYSSVFNKDYFNDCPVENYFEIKSGTHTIKFINHIDQVVTEKIVKIKKCKIVDVEI